MIKAILKGVDPATKKEMDITYLGLSEGNIERLRKGMPIVIKGEDIGLENRIVIIDYGKTENIIRENLLKRTESPDILQ